MCRCPQCGSGRGRAAMTTLTREPRLICLDCKRISLTADWQRQPCPPEMPPAAHTLLHAHGGKAEKPSVPIINTTSDGKIMQTYSIRHLDDAPVTALADADWGPYQEVTGFSILLPSDTTGQWFVHHAGGRHPYEDMDRDPLVRHLMSTMDGSLDLASALRRIGYDATSRQGDGKRIVIARPVCWEHRGGANFLLAGCVVEPQVVGWPLVFPSFSAAHQWEEDNRGRAHVDWDAYLADWEKELVAGAASC